LNEFINLLNGKARRIGKLRRAVAGPKRFFEPAAECRRAAPIFAP
jgi:hypothetical protein